MAGNVRLRLGDPRSQKPGDAQLLNAISTEIRTVKKHERNTSNVWNFNDTIITVQPNLSVYAILAADFGTPLAVLSWAPQLTTWIPRLIPIYQPQNMPYAYGQPPNIAANWNWPADGSFCTAERCSFYWRDGQAYIEFLPVPLQSADYKIRFLQSGNQVGQLALTTQPVTAEDADLVEVRAALALLAVTEWMGGDTKEGRVVNTERRKDLFVTLSTTERELRRQFESAKLQVEGDRLTMRYNPTVG